MSFRGVIPLLPQHPLHRRSYCLHTGYSTHLGITCIHTRIMMLVSSPVYPLVLVTPPSNLRLLLRISDIWTSKHSYSEAIIILPNWKKGIYLLQWCHMLHKLGTLLPPQPGPIHPCWFCDVPASHIFVSGCVFHTYHHIKNISKWRHGIFVWYTSSIILIISLVLLWWSYLELLTVYTYFSK